MNKHETVVFEKDIRPASNLINSAAMSVTAEANADDEIKKAEAPTTHYQPEEIKKVKASPEDDSDVDSYISDADSLDANLSIDDDFDAAAKMDVEMANKRVSVDTVDFMVKKMKEDTPSIGVVNPPSAPGEGKVKKVKIRAGKVVQRARLASQLASYGIAVDRW